MSISVVMATYNGGKYLPQQLQSLFEQTLPPDEIIICDDQSTDNTLSILKSYSQLSYLRYYVNPQRLGVIKNFKRAASLASENNYIALCDQDDIWMSDKLQKSLYALQQIENPNLPCMVYADLRFIDENNELINPSFQNQFGLDGYRHNLESLMFNNFVTGCTVLMNPCLARYLIEIPDDVRHHDEWLALIAFTFGRVHKLNQPAVQYRKHANNVSIATHLKSRNRYQEVLQQAFNAIRGEDDFLAGQFQTISKFIDVYDNLIPKEKRQYFKNFMTLERKPYLLKKMAFRRMINKLRIQ